MAERTTLSRRTLVRAGAWATPVVLVGAAAAPAYATSPVPCPIVASPGGWATTTTGTPGAVTTGGYAWSTTTPYSFSLYRDNGSSTAPFVVTTQTTVTVAANSTYDFAVPVYWGYGNGRADQSNEVRLEVFLGTTRVVDVTTRSSALGAAGTTTEVAGSFRASTTGSVPLLYRFTVAARTRQANDDMVVRALRFTGCAR